MKIEERVKLITDDDVTWDWDSSNPSFNTKTPNVSWGGHTKFDPFPCYSHPKQFVIDIATQVEKAFPISFDTFIFIFPFEPIGRTNGQAQVNTIDYNHSKDDRTQATWEGAIELYGKRIPLHPAMTRYLVSHEYGHIIDTWICRCRHLEINGLDEEYAKMRGIDSNFKYGGRKWHTNTGEIIANDFRICVTGIEREFWPHECKHPDLDDNVKSWWQEAIEKYSIKNK